tara:strand:- start:221 stop:706 length:486 start_codon:yes stop_codon:yes gene_type:complete
MSEQLRESNPYDLVKKEEAPNNYISGDELLSLLNKYGIEFDDTNIPRFADYNEIKMIKVKRVGKKGSTPTYYLEPSKSKIEQIIEKQKKHNSSSLGKKIVKKKIQEILKVFDSAEDNSVSRTSIAKEVKKRLGYPCDRKLVRKVLNKSRKSQLEKKLNKIS